MRKFFFGFVFFLAISCAALPASSAMTDTPVRTVDAPPPDSRAATEADAAVKPYVVGTHIALQTSREDWEAVATSDGRTRWRLAVRSEDAAFLRPHIVSEENAWAEIYGASGIARTVFLFAGVPAWGALVEGDIVFVETTTEGFSPPGIFIDRVSRGTVAFWRPAKEQYCYLDVNCYEDWLEIATAIGLMYYEDDQSESTICSGSLIRDVPQTKRPFFLSANHCVDRQSEAETLIVYWNFTTDVCDGVPPPNVETLPQSDGADFLAGSEVSDYSLMLLHEDPPDGTAYLPFTTDAVPLSEPIAVIHHPAGTFKRISFGNLVGGDDHFWTVIYTEGSTEGGSSGSPLFNSQKQVVGQLSAGLASCWAMQETDDYGKFSSSWDLGLSPYLTNSSLPSTTTTTTTTNPTGDDDDTQGDSSRRQADEDQDCGCGC